VKVPDLSAGLTLVSADWLMVTLLEKRCAGTWLCLVIADFYPGSPEHSGYTTPISFHLDTVEEEGWRLL